MSELSEGIVEETLKLIDKMFYNGEKINYYDVSKKAKVSRQFLYRHPEIVEKILYYKNFNSMSVQKRFSKLKFEKEFMRNQITKYENFLFDFYIGSNEK